MRATLGKLYDHCALSAPIGVMGMIYQLPTDPDRYSRHIARGLIVI